MLLILMNLALRDLITASHVNQEWRALVPKLEPCTRLALLRLAFGTDDNTGRAALDQEKIPLHTRKHFVFLVAHYTGLELPESFRTFMTEWPRARAPQGLHWPRVIHKFTHCDESPLAELPTAELSLLCRELQVTIPTVDLRAIMGGESISSQHRLFNSRPRLNKPGQINQTIRFLRAHDSTCFTHTRPGMQSLKCKVLALDSYNYPFYVMPGDPHWYRGDQGGWHYLILAGPCRGQIHAWSHCDEYTGFEAENFLEWRHCQGVPKRLWD